MTDKIQAQVLWAVVYRVVKQIKKPTNYGEIRCAFDLAYTGNGKVAVSVVNHEIQKWNVSFTDGDISWFSTCGSCVTYDKNRTLIIFSSGEALQYMRIQNIMAHLTFRIWSYEDSVTLYQKKGYTPNGTAMCKTGDILVCLWNQSLEKNSHGLVLKLNMSGKKIFEIESNKSRRLFTCPVYVTENGNEDVCVSDLDAVVVTDRMGMFRFRYTGRGDPQIDPYGICCDSRFNIIIADMKNDKIHMIDEDGEFLHYIQYDGMKMPRALCIDEKDNLYVGEWNCDVIKVILSD